jgi:hypothetical protein
MSIALSVEGFHIDSFYGFDIVPYLHDAQKSMAIVPPIFYLKDPSDLIIAKFRADGNLINIINEGDYTKKVNYTAANLLPRFTEGDGWYIFNQHETIVTPKYITIASCCYTLPESYVANFLVINRETRQDFGRTYPSSLWLSAAEAVEELTYCCYFNLVGDKITGAGLKTVIEILSTNHGKFKTALKLASTDFDSLARELGNRPDLFQNKTLPYDEFKFEPAIKLFEKLYFTLDEPPTLTEKDILGEPCSAGEIIVPHNIPKLLPDGIRTDIRPLELAWIIGGGDLKTAERTPVHFFKDNFPDVREIFIQNGVLHLTPKNGYFIDVEAFSKKTQIAPKRICITLEETGGML